MRTRIVFSIAIWWTITIQCAGQNAKPVVHNLKAVADIVAKQVTITYDLIDSDNESTQITFKVSGDNGSSFVIHTNTATGDIGYPIKTGPGKKIIWNYPYYYNDIDQYQVKLIADDLQKVEVAEIVSRVDLTNIKNTISFLQGERYHGTKSGLKHSRKVQEYVINTFREHQLESYFWKFQHQQYEAKNCVGKLRGDGDEVQTYLLGAHFDTVQGTPGVDDNATGIAGLVEAVRVLSQYTFDHSFTFAAFDLEEAGLLGSKEYAFEGIEDHERLAGMINLDMIGCFSSEPNSQQFPDELKTVFPEAYDKIAKNAFKGDFLLNVANSTSAELNKQFEKSAMTYAPELKVVSLVVPNEFLQPNFVASDHAYFWYNRYNALSLGDTGPRRNVQVHGAGDTLSQIDFPALSNVVKATVALLADLGKPRHASHVTTKIVKLSLDKL